MKSLSIFLLIFINARGSLAFAYSDEDQRNPAYEGMYQDELAALDPRVADLEDMETYPYLNVLQMLRKRSVPRWHHAFVYRNPTYRTSPLAQSKRFLPFHPLARFRGLSMSGGSGGGLIPGSGYDFHKFDNVVSDSNMIPSPGHPVPSGDTKVSELDNEAQNSNGDKSFGGEEVPDVQPLSSEKLNAGDLLRYLSNASASRGLGSHSKVFRFGIK